MADGIHIKLIKLREALRKESFSSFEECVAVADRKAKSYRVLILYCFYGNMARLTLVNIENIGDNIVTEIPVEYVGAKDAKERLYEMVFNFGRIRETITPNEYINLMERMRVLGVKEKDILTRYNLKSLADMPTDVYKKCMVVFDNIEKEKK